MGSLRVLPVIGGLEPDPSKTNDSQQSTNPGAEELPISHVTDTQHRPIMNNLGNGGPILVEGSQLSCLNRHSLRKHVGGSSCQTVTK